MKLIDERSLIRDVAARWRENYGKSQRAIYERLRALDPETATAADVRAIIGNGTWTSRACSECKKDSPAVMQLGDEPDYESSTAWLCLDCADRAYSALVAYDAEKGGR